MDEKEKYQKIIEDLDEIKDINELQDLLYYTENNYSEQAAAEEMVDFIADVKDAALGNSSKELNDVIADKIKKESKKPKKLLLKRIFCNPIIGILMMIGGAMNCGSALSIEDASNFRFAWWGGVILIVLGIFVIYFGIRNWIFVARSAKNMYDAVQERKYDINRFKDRN